MSIYKSSNARIAKNTMLLYVRLVVVMLVGLYTTRVVLNKLGIEDYGIYNIVGGIVALFSFINSALQTATQRFLSYYQSEPLSKLKEIFSSAVLNHLIICVLILFLAETVGLWFVENKLVVPASKMFQVNILYQFSILTVLVSALQIPFNSVIIAHERMSFYAYVSILEAFLYLLMAFLLYLPLSEKLIFYGIAIFTIKAIVCSFYIIYDYKYYHETHLIRVRDFLVCKKQFIFSFWSFWGAMGYTFSQQGINVLLNLFFGPVVNAARGLAVQINTQLSQLNNNYQIAVNPQIVKSYADGKNDSMFKLVYDNMKISFLLNWFLILPLLFILGDVLKLWLVEVPAYTVVFCKIILFKNLCTPLENPFNTMNGATGNNKVFGFMSGVFLNLTLPVCYLLFSLGLKPYFAFISDIAIYALMITWKMYYLHKTISFPYRGLFQEVLWPTIKLLIITFIPVAILGSIIGNSLLNDVIIVMLSSTLIAVFGYRFSLSDEIKTLLLSKLSLIRRKC